MKKTLLALLLSAGALMAEQADIDTFRYIYNYSNDKCEATTDEELRVFKGANLKNNIRVTNSGTYSFGSIYELELKHNNGKIYISHVFTTLQACINYKYIK